MSLRLVQKSVTLNDLKRRNGRYFALFQRIRVASGRTEYKNSSGDEIANVNFYAVRP